MQLNRTKKSQCIIQQFDYKIKIQFQINNVNGSDSLICIRLELGTCLYWAHSKEKFFYELRWF